MAVTVSGSGSISGGLAVAVTLAENRISGATIARIDGAKRIIKVQAVYGKHFAAAPKLKNADQVTLLEEDRICGYYGGGTLYAHPSRQEPLL
jgi:photosynthetic reaction center H subunit